MLISAIAYLKEQGKEWRNVAVYGQEINALTSAIGKMNLFLHGVKDFSIVNGDTLASPAFIENGKLQQFDLCLANPPYSISQWDRAAFESDKYGRNFLGVPPQGRADYALETPMPLPIKEVLEAMCLTVHHAPLPDGVFGRTYFNNATVDIYDRDRNVVSTDIEEGTILVDPDVFFMRNIGSVNNTIIHECVHWDKHYKFFELQKLINPELTSISCAVVEEYKKGAGGLSEELAWMEWQAKLKGNGRTVPPLTAIKTPLRDGDTERPDDPAYAGSYFINANSATAPGIVDADCNPILTRSEVYSGVYGRASINFYAFNSNGNKGIACGLNNLQKIRDGEPLGGKSSAASDFSTDADEDFLS